MEIRSVRAGFVEVGNDAVTHAHAHCVHVCVHGNGNGFRTRNVRQFRFGVWFVAIRLCRVKF